MKKVIISLLLITLFISGCSSKKVDHISEVLSTDLSNCYLEKDRDTHGGFLGDGTYFAKITCKESISLDDWKELPLSEEISTALDLEVCDGKGCENFYNKNDVPNIESGYYYFVDRHSESTNKNSDSELNTRSSYNYSIGIYDNNTKILYFYEFDS